MYKIPKGMNFHSDKYKYRPSYLVYDYSLQQQELHWQHSENAKNLDSEKDFENESQIFMSIIQIIYSFFNKVQGYIFHSIKCLISSVFNEWQ
jgi:hypothetical protein